MSHCSSLALSNYETCYRICAYIFRLSRSQECTPEMSATSSLTVAEKQSEACMFPVLITQQCLGWHELGQWNIQNISKHAMSVVASGTQMGHNIQLLLQQYLEGKSDLDFNSWWYRCQASNRVLMLCLIQARGTSLQEGWPGCIPCITYSAPLVISPDIMLF